MFCFDADPEPDPDPAQNLDADPDPDPDPGGGGLGQPKMCIPPDKILGTPLAEDLHDGGDQGLFFFVRGSVNTSPRYATL